MKNNYNLLAPNYRWISKLVFGNQLELIQMDCIAWIPEKAAVLFIGGGDGRVLRKLIDKRPDLNITYVDQSQKMIDLAKRKLNETQNESVSFICGDIFDFKSIENYDCILTFFFLDQFKKDERKRLLEKLYPCLKSRGKWLLADFKIAKTIKEKTIEKIMFSFLKLTTHIQTNRIENYEVLFGNSYFKLLEKNEFKKSNTFSSVYEKMS